MSTVISIENVSKQYRLGQVGTGTLAHDLNRWWAKLRGKDDPFSRVGQLNDRTQAVATDRDPEYVWALKDINLQVQQGQILGIIGRNGAGKSTLLKLLSRVTAPTTGRIRVKGRMASLLEVGTGFHPELTGRENIYLNGAILGMTRAEIRRRFDEIVEFSGCAKYIDTPVKRYSSGMYVRLAFAVAAHLEPEILIVDEVLAVGDADFQSKCLGKMSEVSRDQGRTILFVSHNMASIKQLCPHSCLFVNGELKLVRPTDDVIHEYLATGTTPKRFIDLHETARVGHGVVPESISIVDHDNRLDSAISSDADITVIVRYQLLEEVRNLRIQLSLISDDGILIWSSSDFGEYSGGSARPAGAYESRCTIPGNLLNYGRYLAKIDFEIALQVSILSDLYVQFEVSELTYNSLGPIRKSRPPGLLHPRLHWEVQKLSSSTEGTRNA